MKLLMFPEKASLPEYRKEYLPPCGGRSSVVAPRYRRVLVLLSQGMTYRQIAHELNIQPVTAWQYIEDVLIKNDDLRAKLAAHALSLLDKECASGSL